MWSVVTLTAVQKLWSDRTELVTFTSRMNYRAGRIPTRSQIEADARQNVRDQLRHIEDTGGNRPYDYGDVLGVSIVSITFIPR